MKVKKGDKIKVDYTGKFDDGEVFDSSIHEDHSHPLEFNVGEGKVIKGFDDAVLGMEKNQEKEFSIESKEAYGEHRKELEKEFPRTMIPKDEKIESGMTIVMGSQDGRKFPVKVKYIDEKKVILDFNHPLAGKRLNFKIKVLEIN